MKQFLKVLSQKWPEYLLEILVLIIGIYGAFALESWNDRRNQQAEERIFLTNVYENLRIDSVQFVYYEKQYQMIETLHVQLYQIGIKNEQVDSLIDPLMIRRSLYFKQLVDTDLADRAQTLLNTQIKQELIDYGKRVVDLEDVYKGQLEGIILETRAYLSQHRVYNTDRWFEVKNKVAKGYTFDEFDGQNIVDKDLLIALSKTKEFQQRLFELNLKWNEFYSRLTIIMEARNQLQDLLEQELFKK